MTPEVFVERFGHEKGSAILRCSDTEKAALAMEAAIRGGFSIIEFTLTIPGVYDLVHDFSKREGLVVGTGTVMDERQAQKSVEAGARFLVSPVVDEAVISAADELGVASMPGTHTPTEMLRAHRAGAQLCKLFPAPAGGPVWVRSVLGPMPYLKIVPTNGVDEQNAQEWISAGVFGVGFVAPLFVPGDIEAGNWDAIEARARRCLEAVKA
ncbi:MAG: bifunctional 4-hydroxy-2-oxoglutarate aldolase/2-dehydro-3-deoxy-phosphogluconate aldolase [Xanthomonadales bacterium]|nr:bifunctional 4-hydroxy-2-oxoglutarate aldolase/2-dehydro-3-deoxy-phosphogluconate aldolase [Gammaproteobacteria bacterium]MBT8053971.1 bifunctional 4-hydroxy-2-oxoglutarate aldolase/2-dehydro-3-deoxy-phosphogluconate aldolase [Gammaproteobacteria bacterium]NND58312.1 bifunctional 4-hydroxy-2-oxoglutarate aldolase/2-dehydro-3-deoxy-phosphogluconate aldolase [Xanthomonadales bacterium]NNK51977.1 bifunctional 4-hydroxy-2-oxoglutarate aldolase/2-dehydro-3-deoxy-phosphogluconate aldolase [Xanthomo